VICIADYLFVYFSVFTEFDSHMCCNRYMSSYFNRTVICLVDHINLKLFVLIFESLIFESVVLSLLFDLHPVSILFWQNV